MSSESSPSKLFSIRKKKLRNENNKKNEKKVITE